MSGGVSYALVMSEENPSCIHHVSIGTNDFNRAVAFYEKVLAAVGCHKVMEFGEAAAFGKKFPEFWVQTPQNGEPANVANGVHVSFVASSPEQVKAFYEAAIEAGATDEGAPGPRPDYGEPYYGGFVRDLDGHKIEATYWDEDKARELGIHP